MRNSHIIADPEPALTVRTHATGATASRLTAYRLKRAAVERDAAMAEANARYTEQVRAIVSSDRLTTAALRRGEVANYRPWRWLRWPNAPKHPAIELSHPFAAEVGADLARTRPWWIFNPADLLQAHGYRGSTRYWLERNRA